MRYRATTANQVLFENIVLHYLADYYNRKLFFGSKCRKKLLPSPAWGAYSAPADPLVGFKGAVSRQGQNQGSERWGYLPSTNSWICDCFLLPAEK